MKKSIKFLPVILGLILIFASLLIVSLSFMLNNDNYGLNGTMIAVISVFLIILSILTLASIAFVFGYEIKVKIDLKKEKKKQDLGKNLDPRFYMLDGIDNKYEENPIKTIDTEGISLEMMAKSFKAFASTKLNLYYDIEDVRRFIAGLGVSKIIILQGMSGTGKTSLAYAFGQFINNSSTIIPIQPMWKERTDLIGYYNEFTKKFNETKLLEVMYEALYSDKLYITVLDEVNIARVEYYFAEFLSLLELPNKENRYLDVVSDRWDNDPKKLNNGQMLLPSNMWFIGTANNDDSTFAISDKVYDRAMIMNLDKKASKESEIETDSIEISIDTFDRLISEAKQNYSISEEANNKLKALDEYMISKFHITFGNRILKQIYEYISIYLALGGDEIIALDDILSKKLFRKIEFVNPSEIKDKAPGLITYIEELFGKDCLPISIDLIKRLNRIEG